MSAMIKRMTSVLKQVTELEAHRPHPALPPVLDGLFGELRLPDPSRPVHELEDEIWALWTGFPDPDATERMDLAVTALAERNFDEAEPAFSGLVADFPLWAEAWNKRATTYYLMEQNYEALGDIRRVLELEPRHFGALSGFGEIALVEDDPAAALTAFRAALRIHPHLGALKHRVASLVEDPLKRPN